MIHAVKRGAPSVVPVALAAILLPLTVMSAPRHLAAGQSSDAPVQVAAAPSADQAPPPLSLPSSIVLKPGELRSLAVSQINRVAVGNPDVMDLTIVSPTELLLQAKAVGKTNLIIWDQQGQHMSSVEVVEHSPEAVEAQLRQVLRELALPDVNISREEDKLFLVGEVAKDDEMGRLEQMLSSFPTATNLVHVSTRPPAPPPPPPLVRLSVQVVELNRTDLEKLGVKWAESTAFTQPSVRGDIFKGEDLFRWGTGITRDSIAMTLNALVKRNRARVLAEPRLVTASGKEASSFIGVEVPIVTATSFGTTTSTVSTSIEFRETGVLLKMTPTIHTDQEPKKISTTIQAEVSDIDSTVALSVPVGSQTVSVPGFKVSKANTQITTLSGQTIVIAGLLKLKEENNNSQVPGLGSVPVFGRLFRSPEVSTEQKEIVIAVTPELISELGGGRPGAVDHAVTAATQVATSSDDPALRYALQIQQTIAQSLNYPERDDTAMTAGRVKLRLQVFRDGTLGQAMVTQSSGIPAFDVEALKAAQSRAPYAPFPPEISQQEIWLEIPVVFNP